MRIYTFGDSSIIGTDRVRINLVYASESLQSSLAAIVNEGSEHHYNITLNVTGDTKDAERLAQELVARLELKMRELDRRTKSTDHFDRMGKAFRMGKERA